MISTRLLVFLSVLAVPVWAANPGEPGAINYVEGQAAIDGSSIGAQSVGRAILSPNQTLSTQNGKVEMLLTPGVFLRLGDDSSVRMVSPGLIRTQVALTGGRAMLEVTDLLKENHLGVSLAGASVGIEKNGLYAFDATVPRVSVYDGKARVTEGDSSVELGKGREAVLNEPNGRLLSQEFDRHQHDDLYAWSDVRSQYLAEASGDSARTIVAAPGAWFGAGWYWNPWWNMYSFIPGSGIFYSPFGWGFCAPGYIAFAPRVIERGGLRHFIVRLPRVRPAPVRIPSFRPAPMRVPSFHAAPRVR